MENKQTNVKNKFSLISLNYKENSRRTSWNNYSLLKHTQERNFSLQIKYANIKNTKMLFLL